jgi:hypothetical protein
VRGITSEANSVVVDYLVAAQEQRAKAGWAALIARTVALPTTRRRTSSAESHTQRELAAVRHRVEQGRRSKGSGKAEVAACGRSERGQNRRAAGKGPTSAPPGRVAAGEVMGRRRILLAGILIGLLIGLALLFGVDLIALAQLALRRLRAWT